MKMENLTPYQVFISIPIWEYHGDVNYEYNILKFISFYEEQFSLLLIGISTKLNNNYYSK